MTKGWQCGIINKPSRETTKEKKDDSKVLTKLRSYDKIKRLSLLGVDGADLEN